MSRNELHKRQPSQTYVVKNFPNHKQGGGSQGNVAAAPPGPLVTTALCPLHGPIIQSSITELVGRYRTWIAEQAILAPIFCLQGLPALLCTASEVGSSKTSSLS